MTDLKEIIESCKRNEHLGQKLLYEQFSPMMRLICLRYTGNAAEAEDLVHDGFIKVYDSIHQFAYKGSFEGWLKRIFINLSINRIKKLNKEVFSGEDEWLSVFDQYYLKEKEVDAEEESKEDLIRNTGFTQDELMEVMDILPQGSRTIFNLYAIEKMTHREIAENLSITEGTSKSQLFRARKALQDELFNLAMKRKMEQRNRQYRDLLRMVI